MTPDVIYGRNSCCTARAESGYENARSQRGNTRSAELRFVSRITSRSSRAATCNYYEYGVYEICVFSYCCTSGSLLVSLYFHENIWKVFLVVENLQFVWIGSSLHPKPSPPAFHGRLDIWPFAPTVGRRQQYTGRTWLSGLASSSSTDNGINSNSRPRPTVSRSMIRIRFRRRKAKSVPRPYLALTSVGIMVRFPFGGISDVRVGDLTHNEIRRPFCEADQAKGPPAVELLEVYTAQKTKGTSMRSDQRTEIGTVVLVVRLYYGQRHEGGLSSLVRRVAGCFRPSVPTRTGNLAPFVARGTPDGRVGYPQDFESDQLCTNTLYETREKRLCYGEQSEFVPSLSTLAYHVIHNAASTAPDVCEVSHSSTQPRKRFWSMTAV